MINRISFTVKGDYNEMTLHREADSNWVEMQYHHYNGCAFARFRFEDLKKAVELLEGQSDD